MAVFTCPPPKKHKIAQNTQVLARQLATGTSVTSNSINMLINSEPDVPLFDKLDAALEIPDKAVDEAMEHHNTIEVQKAVGTAIEKMAQLYNLHLTDAKLKEA
ncbi:hypothetical protein RHS01_01370 [Rhizoctonia solani]|uniref:Uncharacterized protein n=1 Tax=Rhizoctonia solani TaxID=456999 RepID=A0A8H7ILF0_9AGAM|nr:hypothetical protein RHS01_01370 [Rhizoctonia solani]